jgi:hypothetical protein
MSQLSFWLLRVAVVSKGYGAICASSTMGQYVPFRERVLSGRLVINVGRWITIVGFHGGLMPPVPSTMGLVDSCCLVPMKLM